MEVDWRRTAGRREPVPWEVWTRKRGNGRGNVEEREGGEMKDWADQNRGAAPVPKHRGFGPR